MERHNPFNEQRRSRRDRDEDRERGEEDGYGRRAMRGRDYSRIGRPYGDERYGRRPYDRDFGEYDPDYGYNYDAYERDYGRSDFNRAYNRGDDDDRSPGYDRDRDYDRVDYGRESMMERRYGTESGEGPHRGRGPQGYRRSSERIEEDVNDRLTEHGHLDASDVRVSVEEGEVTLEGTVESRRAKRLADDIAGSVRGVRDVHNRLRIASAQEGEG